MVEIVRALRGLARAALKPTLQKIHSRLGDPIRLYEIDGMRLFAHANEHITRTFPSYKIRPDNEKYNDFFFVRLMHEQYGACNLIDVGVNYGADLLLLSGYKSRQGIPGEIIGFEPNTRTYSLLRHTFRENGIAARFEHMALGEKPGSIILEGTKNQSQGMTTVGITFPDIYEVVEVKPLDQAISHLLDQPCFLKLDTQGAEWLIFKGATSFCRKTDIVVRSEFTPGGTKGISGPELLQFYLDRFAVIDAKTNSWVTAEARDEFCTRVQKQYYFGYTDLYLIPTESPLMRQL